MGGLYQCVEVLHPSVQCISLCGGTIISPPGGHVGCFRSRLNNLRHSIDSMMRDFVGLTAAVPSTSDTVESTLRLLYVLSINSRKQTYWVEEPISSVF